MERVSRIVGHLKGADRESQLEQHKTSEVGENPVRWNGWGFKDTEFTLDQSGEVALTGTRYLFSGKCLPSLRTWMEDKAGLDVSVTSPSQEMSECTVPGAQRNEAFLTAIKGMYRRLRTDDEDRLFHAHGHTSQEIYTLRYGHFKRVPDVVVYPGSHADVEGIVAAAVEHNVVIIPFGGGTSVSWGLVCPENEKRMIVSMDMHEMSRIKWINKRNMLACIEAGAVGKDIDTQLRKHGVVMGHEPDSSEFSTMGGWVATRASGMRKNRYGNIEDILVKAKMVTAKGTMEKSVQVPRMSTGPDVNQVMLGSEGTLGVVTEAVVRLRPVSEVTRYGSMIFPNFESGVACLHEVAMRRCQPVSIRLVDNMQFQFGQALKPPTEDWKKAVFDKMKKWYVINRLKFDPDNMVAATLLFEGTKAEVDAQEKLIYKIAAKYGGMKAGEENGIRGYFLTYMIAYLRDFGLKFCFMAESFETSIPWENVLLLCTNVKEVIHKTAEKEGVISEPFVSCRVTQLYDTGACVYFYFGFLWNGLKDPVQTFHNVEHAAREEILKLGGSLSHHHGVGKLRQEWMPRTIGDTGMGLLRGIKQTLDPTNVFGNGNFGL